MNTTTTTSSATEQTLTDTLADRLQKLAELVKSSAPTLDQLEAAFKEHAAPILQIGITAHATLQANTYQPNAVDLMAIWLCGYAAGHDAAADTSLSLDPPAHTWPELMKLRANGDIRL